MSYFGTNNDDIINVEASELVNDIVNGRRGYDILAISSPSDYTFSRDSYFWMRRIEEIDFSGINGNLSVQVTGS